MFYAATAALRAEGVVVAKHATLIAEFGKRFAKTGRVEVRRHRELIDAMDDRQEADYNVFMKVDKAQASRRVEQAVRFVHEIEVLLADRP